MWERDSEWREGKRKKEETRRKRIEARGMDRERHKKGMDLRGTRRRVAEAEEERNRKFTQIEKKQEET